MHPEPKPRARADDKEATPSRSTAALSAPEVIHLDLNLEPFQTPSATHAKRMATLLGSLAHRTPPGLAAGTGSAPDSSSAATRRPAKTNAFKPDDRWRRAYHNQRCQLACHEIDRGGKGR